jgi:hypothetical protein
LSFEQLLSLPPFGLDQQAKNDVLTEELSALTAFHRARCEVYDRIVAALFHAWGEGRPSLEALPFVPVGVFKSHLLASVVEADVFKTITSSGTTGQTPSRVVLDRETAERQARALAAIMGRVVGPARLPMLVVDHPGVLRDRRSFSARAAGVLGMMGLGRSHTWLLDEEMRLDRAALDRFLQAHAGRPFLVFGFTFMVWRHLYEELAGSGVDMGNGVLVHSGGWKALEAEAVDNDTFRRELASALGLRRVHNFYGMAEQVGSVFLEAPDGWLRAPSFAEVIIRDPTTWEPANDGTAGVVQVLSVLPKSYPGHSILTEDLGVVDGHGDPATGWGGRRLRILGRVPRAELRGCSDVLAAEAAGR